MTAAKLLPSSQGFMAGHPSDDPALPLVRIIPFGLEATVSYEGGTKHGPEAMLKASHTLSSFDAETWSDPSKSFRVETVEPQIVGAPVEAGLYRLAQLTAEALDDGAFPFVWGGEHAITPGALRPFVERWPDLALLHFDAHADLRDGYDGEHFSHAAAIRRCLDHPQVSVVSVGIRNISAEEIPFYDANRERIHIHWGKDRDAWNIDEIIEPLRGKTVYVTIDVDGFDASVMPATGTPEPGGVFWQDVTSILKAASEVSTWVGADINELAPREGLFACDRLAAQLAYKLLGYHFMKRA